MTNCPIHPDTEKEKVMARRWFKNQAGTKSTIVRVDVALLREDFDFIAKAAKEQGISINAYLYHLCREGIDRASQTEYDIRKEQERLGA